MTITRTDITFALGALAVAVIFGVAVSVSPLAVFGLFGAAALVYALWNRPRAALVVWLASLAIAPYWAGVDIFGFLPAPTVVGGLVLITTLGKGYTLISKWDLYVAAFVIVAFLGVFLVQSTRGAALAMITHWALAYAVARFFVPAVGREFFVRAVACVLAAIGGLAVVEYLLSWHPFATWEFDNPPFRTWSPIQVRAGAERSEWSFGHSIALGGSLVLAIPFIIASKFSTPRTVLLLALVAGGIVCSLSRGGLIAAALTFVLSLYALGGLRRGQRQVLAVVAVGLSGWFAYAYSTLTEGAGQETAQSSSYRARLYEDLIGGMRFIGRSGLANETPDGVRYGQFRSIDNTFLAIGLGYGWLLAALAIVPFVVMAIRVVVRTASAPEVALVGLLPVLTTVAMITQYQMVVWLTLGAAVAFYATHRAPVRELLGDHDDDAGAAGTARAGWESVGRSAAAAAASSELRSR